jgi:transcriptional regulator with XRE-family HTH domain
MKEIGERVKYLRADVLKLTQEEFSQQMSISRTSLSMIENHRAMPGFFFMYILHTHFKVNLHWLVSGKGDCLNLDSPDLHDLHDEHDFNSEQNQDNPKNHSSDILI